MGTMRTRATSPRHLPIDIVNIILSRLPSKSLLRFRCVCKSWRDLINDSKFMEFHRNKNNNDHILTLSSSSLHTNCKPRTSVLPLSQMLTDHTLQYLRFPKFFDSSRQSLTVCGCSNGLVLVCMVDSITYFSETILWNPSIRKHKVLPNTNLNIFASILVVGFVPRINDYKVLSLAHRRNGGRYHVEIYSLGTNSWKRVEDVAGCIVQDGQLNRVVNGVIHFMAFDEDTNCEFILRFDMTDEVFTKIKIPQLYPHPNMFMMPMMFEEELVLLVVDKQYDVAAAEKSWIKVFTTDKWFKPLGFLKDGNLMCRQLEQGKLGLYDPRLRKVNDLVNSWDYLSIHSLFHYTESLILLSEGDSDQIYWR